MCFKMSLGFSSIRLLRYGNDCQEEEFFIFTDPWKQEPWQTTQGHLGKTEDQQAVGTRRKRGQELLLWFCCCCFVAECPEFSDICRNYLTLGGAVPPWSARPQTPAHQEYRK